MGNGAGPAAVMEGIHASVARLDALFLEDARLEADAGADADADADGSDGTVVDVLPRRYEIRLERMAVTKQLEAQISAVKARDASEAIEIQHAMTPPEAPVHERTYAEMSAVEEIAGVLTISSAAAGALITQSRQLTALPPAMDALSAGTISWMHAKIIAEETDSLSPTGAAALVAHVLNPNPARGAAAGDLVPGRFRSRARNWRERHHPESLEKRHTKSAADRRMECTPDRDGMAWLSLYLPAHQVSAIWNRTTALARGLQSPDEPRTITQLRPDIAASLLLSAGPALTRTTGPSTGQNTTSEGNPGEGNPGQGNTAAGKSSESHTHKAEDGARDAIGLAALATADQHQDPAASTGASDEGVPAGTAEHEGSGTTRSSEIGNVRVPRADVLVTVPMVALLGLTDEPAHLDGFGPIPASMARKLLANGATSFYRVLVDPRDGAPLEIGRTNYRLTKAMKKALQVRDGKCTFPGCNNPSLDNEIDHLQAWQDGGNTGISNLAQLCPKHHHLKHNSLWEPTPATKTEPPGWTSPTGRHYKAEQPDREPPQWPPGLLTRATDTAGFLTPAQDPPATEAPGSMVSLDVDSPFEEPVDDNLEDPHDFSPDDPIWDDFYAHPPKLPKDPLKEWQRKREWDMVNS
ncbi:HNH endonuclease signature motif containing protein [Pseudarthrobacter sp. W1I19]|uniref:HNH endonuclease signature motif containing protein n=1 Tax=Pseudarthrobacter sp. W1I19 TaxID=3042288 RepID=UPI0027D8CE86|nr:HNH endonuclease signature motif containing protein [Pseudarthrobacter sp. W1I19]